MKRKRRTRRKRAGGGGSPACPQRLGAGRWKKVAFSAITVVLALALLEGASRIVVQLAPNARWEYRCRMAAALGFPALNDIFVADQTLFWRVKPNLNKHLLFGRFADAQPLRFRVSTDGRGFRAMPAVGSPRHRVLLLGDSCTFGLGVEDDQTFAALLQNRLEGVQCINAGVPGYTAYQGRVLLEQLQLDPPPDVVVITFGRNDSLVWDHLSDVEHAELMTAERSRLINRFRFVELLRNALPGRDPQRPAQDRPSRPRLTDAEFVDQVRSIIRWCRNLGAEPILVIWPDQLQMQQAGTSSKQAALASLARSQRLRVLDLLHVFRRHGDRGLFLDSSHASPAGCQLAADKLLPLLQRVLGTSAEQIARP